MKTWRTICFLHFIFLLTHYATSQITGTIIDSKSKKPLAGCEVFINNTTIFSSTDENGFFDLQNIDVGFYDLVIYKKNYEIFKSPIRIKLNEAYKLNIPISKNRGIKSEIEKDPNLRHHQDWTGNIDQFRIAFLGSNIDLSLVRIVNEKDISFQVDGSQLTISSKLPLQIENLALGYNIHYYFSPIIVKENIVEKNGFMRFESLDADYLTQQATWSKNRVIAFKGTSQHLFQSIINGQIDEEGFQLEDENGERLNYNSLIKPSKIESYYNIDFPNLTQVHYPLKSASNQLPKEELIRNSWITKVGSIDVSQNGLLISNAAVTIEGDLAADGIISLLPINYIPEDIIADEGEKWRNFDLLMEKVYIHTDRDYYYPRETIWFKAYLGYSMPALRDTLSRLLYVEFINPDGEIIYTKQIKIRNGVGWGQFRLPTVMDNGEYYMRAYTYWMLNYKQNIYTRPVPILALKENLVEAPASDKKIKSDYQVKIVLDKNQFSSREQINLSVEVFDSNGNSVPANLSIAVVDSDASTQLPEIANILEPEILKVEVGENKDLYFEPITHLLERGISVAGKVVDYRGKLLMANLDIIQGNMDNLISLQTNTNGEFIVSGLDYMDSLYFAFKSTSDKGKILGKVELIKKEIPEFNYKKPKLSLKLRPDDALQRIQNTYDLENTRMLKEVVVTAKASKEEKNKLMYKLYGKPDHVVKGSLMWSIAGTNPLVSLQGLVPGLRVTTYRDNFSREQVMVTIRGGASSMSGNRNPLILVDGNLWSDPNDLIGLSASTIDYVEIITRASAIYGSRGANGIIAIYTKQSADFVDSKPDYSFYNIKGYSRPQEFIDPDYGEENQDSNPDFRTTIYWNPYVTTSAGNPGSVAFYSADIETKYRITVEGITIDGKPLRGEAMINIVR